MNAQRITVQFLCGFALVILVLFLHIFVCAEQGENANPNELVRGVITRSEAVFSGRVIFQQVVVPLDKEKTPVEKDESFVFSGTSWAVFTDGSDAPYEVSHRGKYIIHSAVSQPDGAVVHKARIKVEEPINNLYPRLPFFAGSFWRKTTQAYVSKNAKNAEDKGEVEVNGIPTRVLEWRIPEKDKYEAFHSVGEMTDQGGVLRLYIASQLGYVLPCIEIVGTDGKVNMRYNSFNFLEVVPGVFFPRRCQWLTYDRSGKYMTSTFELKIIEKINEPIPEEVFKMYLPLGTTVVDTRSGKGSHIFKIQKESDLHVEGLDDVVQTDSEPSVWRRRWFAIGIGVTAGLLVVLAILFHRRRRAKGGVPI